MRATCAHLAGARETVAAAPAGHETPPRAASGPPGRVVAPSLGRLDEGVDAAAAAPGARRAVAAPPAARAVEDVDVGCLRGEGGVGKRPPATSGRQPDATGGAHRRGHIWWRRGCRQAPRAARTRASASNSIETHLRSAKGVRQAPRAHGRWPESIAASSSSEARAAGPRAARGEEAAEGGRRTKGVVERVRLDLGLEGRDRGLVEENRLPAPGWSCRRAARDQVL